MLCHRNINHLRKSLSLSSIQIHSNSILYQPTKSFCAVTKLQSPSTSNIFNEEAIINSIKQTHKSEQLSDYLANLNLKKSGNKDTKIQRLITYFNENTQNLNEMNETSLKSYCDFFNLSVNDNSTKTELISILSSFITNDDTQNTENVIETDVNSEEIGEEETFKFQMDQERADQVLIENESNDLKLIEIDEKQSFLHKYPIEICSKVSYPNGSEIVFETSRIGHLSESAIIVNCKGTIVYTTAISKLQSELRFIDSLDLKVDAHERSWSRGYIPSGMQRSDGGITDYEILLCRMIDRSIRPLFIVDDDDNHILPSYEVQILSNLLSCDDIYDTQILAINGASAAIYCSSNIDIGNNGPIGAVRVIIDKNDKMICNPTKIEIEDKESKCNLLYVGTKENCVMIETDANMIDDDKYCKLLQFAQENVIEIIKSIEELKNENDKLNNNKNIEINNNNNNDIINKYNKLSEYKGYLLNKENDIIKNMENELFSIYSNYKLNKNERNLHRNLLKKEMISSLSDKSVDIDIDINLTEKEWNDFYESIFIFLDRKQFRNTYILNNIRCDGRKFDELRDLNAMIDILPSCHGSSLFERGNTQNLVSATLGPPRLGRMRDLHKAGHPEIRHRLYFQYEMPPSATNEIKAIQSKNRRAIGHANIALNALLPLLPSFDSFPYSIRIYSTITSSDGSSSMASVCGGSLSLMDAGIPIIEHAAGISIGLISDQLLTDINGIEDHFGDMDFKIAGTKNGINSVQLDIKKNNGIPINIILNAIKQSYNTRIKILNYMNNIINESKSSLKNHAPRVEIIDIPFRDLPRIIGSGGATKQKIQIDTKCDINIFWEEECVEITAPNIISLNKAKRAIQDVIGSQCRIGDIITAKIINIQSYGVMIQIDDGSEHLVHISQWIDNDDNNTQYQEGQDVDIMCIGFLGENRPNFSRKAALWQLSDDPEDRARLRLMLDSLRPPARSRGYHGSTSSVTSSSSSSVPQNNNGNGIKNREPISIFNTDHDDNDDNIDINIDIDEDEDNDTTHPSILPPKKPFSFSSKGKEKTNNNNNNNESIKNLIDNISSNKPISNDQSRFANLYKDIHDVDDNNNDKKENVSSNFSQLIDSMGSSSIHPSRSGNINNNNDNNNNNKDSIENWKNFTKDLMASNGNIIEKDDDGDDLLTDLFGDKHKSNQKNQIISNDKKSRASQLMYGVNQLIDDLNDDDDDNNNDNDTNNHSNNNNHNNNNNKNDKNDDKWPWMEQNNYQ